MVFIFLLVVKNVVALLAMAQLVDPLVTHDSLGAIAFSAFTEQIIVMLLTERVFVSKHVVSPPLRI